MRTKTQRICLAGFSSACQYTEVDGWMGWVGRWRALQQRRSISLYIVTRASSPEELQKPDRYHY